MDIQQKILARRYAAAYLNCFIDTLERNDIQTIQTVSEYLKQHVEVLFLLKMPARKSIQEKIVAILFSEFNLADSLENVVDLLMKQQRLFIFPDVLDAIGQLYKKRKNIMDFSLKTSHEVSEKQLDIIKTFLHKQTGANVIARHTVDPSLIAGIRMLSDTVLWEHSIAKQLREAEHASNTVRNEYGN